jgi:hypothetical protein
MAGPHRLAFRTGSVAVSPYTARRAREHDAADARAASGIEDAHGAMGVDGA